MDWKERAEAYRRLGADKKLAMDDAVARQIIKGLGWTIERLNLLRAVLGMRPGEPDDEISRLGQAEDVLDVVSGGMFGPMSPHRKFLFTEIVLGKSDAFLKGKTMEGLCRLAAAQVTSGGVIAFNRNKSEKQAQRGLAYVLLHDKGNVENIPEWLLRPVSVLKWRSPDGNVGLWIRPIAAMVHDMMELLKWDVPVSANYGSD